MIKKLNKPQLQNILGGHGDYCEFPDGKILVSYFYIEEQCCDWMLFNDVCSALKIYPELKSFSFGHNGGCPSALAISMREKAEQSRSTNYYRETSSEIFNRCKFVV